MILTRYI